MKKLVVLIGLLVGLLCGAPAFAQNLLPSGDVLIQADQAKYYGIPIQNTGAVNAQVTLTIPAASGLYNYVCALTFNASQSGTGAAINNAVTTSTNFNNFAIKFSILAVASQANYDWYSPAGWGTPATGCVKSILPGTATTFVSPAAAAQTAFTWTAIYYQAQ